LDTGKTKFAASLILIRSEGKTMPVDKKNKDFGQFLCKEIQLAEVIHAALSTRPLDRVLNWIEHNLKPEHVFSAGKLCEWAEENGFIREG
jgi:hypothetical protein